MTVSYKHIILSDIITDLLGHTDSNFRPEYLFAEGGKLSHKETCYECGNTIRTGSYAGAQLVIDEEGNIIGVVFVHNQDWAITQRADRNCSRGWRWKRLRYQITEATNPWVYMNEIDSKLQDALKLMKGLEEAINHKKFKFWLKNNVEVKGFKEMLIRYKQFTNEGYSPTQAMILKDIERYYLKEVAEIQKELEPAQVG